MSNEKTITSNFPPRRGDLLAAACPSRLVLRHLTSRWGMFVMIVLQAGTHRFSALRREIGGISERMLMQTLQDLEVDGLVHRHDFRCIPPHVEYSLTPLGAEAAVKVWGVVDWIETNLPRIAENWPHAQPVRKSQEP